MKLTDKITVTNEDNMELMSRYEDNHFSLAIVDPPYGIQTKDLTGFKNIEKEKDKRDKCKEWDTIPNEEYFKELFRVSKNQIIWGCQYFTEFLPNYSQPIIWDKKTGNNYFADGEMAFCSIKGTLRIFEHQWCGAFKDSERGVKAIHINQKPVALYDWLLDKYAKKGDKILDTHLGSGSITISCYDKDFELVACELDTESYEASLSRFKDHTDKLKFDIH